MPLHSESRRVMNKPNLQMSVPNFSPRVDRLLAFDLICQGRWVRTVFAIVQSFNNLFLVIFAKKIQIPENWTPARLRIQV